MTIRSHTGLRFRAGLLLLGAALALSAAAGCDAVEPVEEARLVVEAFLEAGKPLPPLTLRRTGPLAAPYAPDEAAVADAEVALEIDGRTVAYRPDDARPGRYVPEAAGTKAAARTTFRLRVRWQRQTAVAAGTIPPPITLDSVSVRVPERPVQAVLLDSLNLGIDSLSVDVRSREGFIYPVEVTLWWTVDFDETGPDSLYWIETQLQPRTAFSSTIVDFFLLPEQILREREMPRDARGRRAWTGVYAVPVETKTEPLPVHDLKVALLRSGQDYARFATSRDAPERREPISNVEGALGIVAGISVDSLRVRVGPGGP
ncbi:DUF4249 family protein [Rhodocaloribacter sp.]